MCVTHLHEHMPKTANRHPLVGTFPKSCMLLPAIMGVSTTALLKALAWVMTVMTVIQQKWSGQWLGSASITLVLSIIFLCPLLCGQLILFTYFFNVYLFFERHGGAERGGQRIWSELCADSSKSNVGLEFMNYKIMTWLLNQLSHLGAPWRAHFKPWDCFL